MWTARLDHRTVTHLTRALLLLGLALALSACRDSDAPSSAPLLEQPGGVTVIDLRVEVRADEDAEPVVSTLRCDAQTPRGTGELATRAEEACRTARERKSILVGSDTTDRICTEQYGGPQVARVTGTIDNDRVDATIKRNDGCGIADWEALQPLLGPPPGG